MGLETNDRRSSACLGRAIADELRRMYPHHTLKYLSTDLDCGPKLAESILGGSLSTPTIGRLIAAYGAGWVAERVLEAANTNLEEYIDNKAAAAERAVANARERAYAAKKLSAKCQAAVRSGVGRNG